MPRRGFLFAVMVAALWCAAPAHAADPVIKEYLVPKGSHPHDIAPARDGGVWYTAQASGELGWLDPKTGKTKHIPLGKNSAPPPPSRAPTPNPARPRSPNRPRPARARDACGPIPKAVSG